MQLQALAALLVLLVQIDERPPSSGDEIAAAAGQLGSDDFSQREEATRLLWSAWPASQKVLELAAMAADREVAARAKAVIDNVRLGVFPDTPSAVVQLISQFRAADDNERPKILRKIHDMSQSRVVIALVVSEPDMYRRQALAKEILQEGKQKIADALALADYAKAEELLALAAQIDDDGQTMRDYGALLLLQGRLDETIARLTTTRESNPHPRGSRVLARLLQIRGDIAEAKKLAETAGDEWLLYDLQFRTGDWASLARYRYHQRPDQLEDCGFRAAYHRLAGNQQEFEQAVLALRDIARNKPDNARWCGRNLMINGRWDDAREVFATSHRWSMFELDRSRLEFSRAFRSLGILEPRTDAARSFIENNVGKLLFGITIATTLHELGELHEGTRLLERLETVAPEYPGMGEGSLLKAQLALGHRELANRFASVHVADDKVVLRILFGLLQEEGRVYVAHEWWSHLRSAKAHESHATTLASVLHILRAGPGDASKAAIVELIDGARAASAQLPLERRYYRLNAVAEACAIWGENDRARAIWSEQLALAPDLKPNGSTYDPPRTLGPLLRIADLWAREGRWEQAAATYRAGWETHQDYEIALYRCGNALVKAGRETEGRKLMEQAIILPLADVERREKLVETMQKIGLRDEALAQCEIVLRVGPYEEWEGSRSWAVAHAAEIVAEHVAPSNPLRAAELWQYRLFRLMKSSGDAGEYVDAVHQFHKARALGLLAGDRLDDAAKEIRLAQAAKLGDVELVEKSFVKFAAAGRAADAERLLAENYAAYEAVVRDFPRSAVHHNGLARLAAHCGRKLDAALTHAQEAVRLMPQRPDYLDTLAEVYFRRGDIGEAIASETKATQLDPTSKYFQEQLRRFKKAK